MGTFGQTYEQKHDGPRIAAQMEKDKAVMLTASDTGHWLTLREIENLTSYPQASISAQLRHLRKAEFGSYIVEKRRVGDPSVGVWEYQVTRPEPEVKASGAN